MTKLKLSRDPYFKLPQKMLRFFPVLVLVLACWSCKAQPTSLPALSQLTVEDKAAAEAFGLLVDRLSGPGGYFDTDNLISNESSYLHVVPRLKKLDLEGGVYLGVGPDQNFSYIAHLKPSLAIILDIRRDNMLTHLFYKALFELSEDRVGFLSNLFARYPSTSGNQSESLSVDQLMDLIEQTEMAGAEDVNTLIERLEEKILQFGVPLDDADLAMIRQIHQEFIEYGPLLRFTSHGRSPQSYYPTYRELATEKTLEGEFASFLSEEQHFQFLKHLHEMNRIIPVVGNFAGEHPLPEIARYLKEENMAVSAFYTSNVEFYLMYQQQISRFTSHVAELPLREGSIFIRSYFNRWRAGHPLSVPGYGSTQLLQPIETMLSMSNPSYRQIITEGVLDY